MNPDMIEASGKVDKAAARTMLETFASVGAQSFDVTLTNQKSEKIRFRKQQSLNFLRSTLPAQLDAATSFQHNLIVRPHGPGMFIQLDDLDAQAMGRIKPVAFLGLQTSPGNYQAWIAMQEAEDKYFARRLRKGAGADDTASGATRVAGSLNFKDRYAPEFPRVEITHSTPGLFATRDQLESLGLVAAPEVALPSPARISQRHSSTRKWPSYDMCVNGAPPNQGKTGPDISRADFTWSMTALDWGHSAEDTASKLMEVSRKAQENGERYANLTVQNAAAAVERRRVAQR